MKWTIKEDKLIAEALVRNNNKKTIAFQDVATNLGVSKIAVSNRYYKNKKSIDIFARSLQRLNSYLEQTVSIKNIHSIKKKDESWYIKLWNNIKNILK